MQAGQLAPERQQVILNRLSDTGAVRVVDLARDLHVTTETIRRDLRLLDQEGRIQRTHGGAVLIGAAPSAEREPPLHLRQSIALPEKAAVAAEAATLVQPGEVVALDASSTAIELAKRLPDHGLTVVSPSPVVCLLLAERKSTRVVCTGGVLDDDAVCFTGPVAEAVLEKLHIDRCFLSCQGLHLARGASEATDRHAALKAQMLAVSDRAVLMVHSSKLGVSGPFYFARAGVFDTLIVDRQPGSDDLPRLREVSEQGGAGFELREVDPEPPDRGRPDGTER